MKNSTPASVPFFSQPPLCPAILPLGFILAAGCLGLTASVRAQEPDIGVRSKVMDKDLQWSHKSGSLEEGGHSKTFAIVAIDEVKNAEPLVKPVDQENILRQLFEQLQANGFKKYAKGTKPDILLAVSYGRGDMANPYERDTGETPGDMMGSGAGLAGVPTTTITGAFAQQLMDEKTPGYEAKLQKASYEKLFIRVTAFAYPTDPKAKPKMLWKTVIVADDPDHRDLNAIAGQMIKAGAAYFDKDIKTPEIEFPAGVPEGKVNVGPATVVESAPKK
jgi:hypothetical protein